MPLPGGASAKYGDRYEGKWTVYCLAQVMAEAAHEIRLEDPGPEGEGCEFSLKKPNGTTEFHQVKRQRATPAAWTIGDLNSKGVLQTAYARTNSEASRFVFVSTLGSSELAELVDAARRAGSLSEFLDEFVTAKFKRKAWEALLRAWKPLVCKELDLDPDEDPANEQALLSAYERLQRIVLRVNDETSLEEMVDARLRLLVRGVSPDTLRAELAAYALEHVHDWLDTAALWQWVAEKGYGHTNYAKDDTVTAAIKEQNLRHKRMVSPIAGTITIPRQEAQRAFDILTGDQDKHSVLVSGSAGIGKSGVLAQVIELLRGEGIPYLWFRVDRCNPSPLPKVVGEQLGLPESPTEVLANIARGNLSVLVIDQLDDVSRATGRNPDFFECIDEIIRQAADLPGVRLLLACRQFDLQKDNRLRELVQKEGPAVELPAELFSVAAVRSVLEKLGQDADSLPADQIELLRLPLHLSMYADVLAFTPQKVPVLRSKIDLFVTYWDMKYREVDKRLDGKPCRWTNVVDRLCERMTDDRSLFVDEMTLDDFRVTADVMLTERVLVLEEGRVGFFHAAFFDYVYARRFLANKNDLLAYVLDGEQGLFKRPVLRQIVIYGVEKAFTGFADAIRDLLFSPEVRFHLKQCALDAIEQSGIANALLWSVFQDVLRGEDANLIRVMEKLLVASSAWFSFLHESSNLSKWLSSDEPVMRGRGRWCVNQQIEKFPNECASLLVPHVGATPEWDAWILRVSAGRALSKSRGLFDIFLSFVAQGAIPADATPDFWTYIYSLHKTKPTWAAEAISAYLNCWLRTMTAEEFELRVLKKSVHGDEVIPEIAARSPQEFLEGVLPIFLEVVEQHALPKSEGLRTDSVWTFRAYGSSMDVKDALLEGIGNALRQVAEDDPVVFQLYFERLAPYGDYDSVNFLLMRAFAALDVTCVDQAVVYMLETPQRLESGWQMGGGQYWAAREAVLHISGLCSGSSFEELENLILGYSPAWERSAAGHRVRGRWQLVMLTAMESERRSQTAEARIGELERKFPQAEIAAPEPISIEWIGPPIPEESATKMSDANWLRAISKYDQDRDHVGEDHRLRGGAVQLSRVLETATENDPERFAKLARSFTEETNPYYFDAVLMGLRKADAAKETVFDAIRYFFGLPNKPGGRWMSDAVTKYASEEIPEDILGIIGWLATEAIDPETDAEAETWSEDAPKAERPGNYLNRAINSVRESAAKNIGHLLYAAAVCVPFFTPYLERMVTEPTVTVRSTVAHALLGLFAHQEKYAVDLFLRLCEIESDVLLATRHVDRFLYHGNARHFAQLRAIVERMLGSKMAIVRESGARQVCLAQFRVSEAIELAGNCVTGDEAQRKGAAIIAAANVFKAECREFCESALIRFFDDPSEDVLDVASRCFLHAKARDLEQSQTLIRSFLNSKCFPEKSKYLIMGLKGSTGDLSGVIVEVCEAVLLALETSPDESFGRLHLEARNLAELVFRAYAQSNDPDYRDRCLSMIDRFVASQAYGVVKHLDEYER